MKGNRRRFIKNALISGVTAAEMPLTSCGSKGQSQDSEGQYGDFSRLNEILKQPVFKKELFSNPVNKKSIELRKYKENYLCRIGSEEGGEGISVGHPFQQKYLNS